MLVFSFMKTKYLLPILMLLGPSALAVPAQVLIIRHAEKNESGPDISPKGQERAQALVQFFRTDPRVTKFGLPVAIFASSPKHEGSSMRPIETVTPLAQALNMEIHEEFHHKNVDELVDKVMSDPKYDNHMVLICWSHDQIPDIASTFGIDPPSKKWNKKAFDRVWALTFVNGKPMSIDDFGQHLLPGDSPD